MQCRFLQNPLLSCHVTLGEVLSETKAQILRKTSAIFVASFYQVCYTVKFLFVIQGVQHTNKIPWVISSVHRDFDV